MKDLNVFVQEQLDVHWENEGKCMGCHQDYPCPSWRLASDWLRQRNDLVRAWINRTGLEIKLVHKYLCSQCSDVDTGLVCDECISEADTVEDLESE